MIELIIGRERWLGKCVALNRSTDMPVHQSLFPWRNVISEPVAPDVDCRVLLESPLPVGQFSDVAITGSQVYDLVAERAACRGLFQAPTILRWQFWPLRIAPETLTGPAKAANYVFA